MKRVAVSVFFLCSYYFAAAQLPPVGNWREHLPYGSAIKLQTVNDKVFCATPYSFFSLNTTNGELQKYSRVNGLSETGISTFKYDAATNILLLAYSNSNIDLLSGSQIININDIKRKALNGDKSIYAIFFANDKAYIGTGFGIVVIDLIKKETKDTYLIGNTGNPVKVSGITADGNFLYAATAEGLKRAPLTANLVDFNNWQPVPALSSTGCTDIISYQNKLLLLKNDSVLVNNGSNWNLFYHDAYHIESMHVADGNLFLSETITGANGRVVVTNALGVVQQLLQATDNLKMPQDALSFKGAYYVADLFGGLRKITGSNIENIVPNSPFEKASGEMVFYNNKLYVCAGEVDAAWVYTYDRNGMYTFDRNTWSTYNQYNYPVLDSLYDMITVAVDPVTEKVYCGSYSGGLAELSPGNQYKIYKQNSIIQPAIGDPTSYRISGLAFDADDNLWISNYGAPAPLLVKKADNTWRAFTTPLSLTENAVAQVLVDDFNNKWIVSPKGNGLICYNSGSNIDIATDDKWKLFTTTNGNLPDNNVHCVAKDKNGFIWVGTDKGVAVMQCMENVFTGTCNAVLPIIQQGSFNGYLFAGQVVQTIAVDGANRKWIGTQNGLWLVSADGDKVIYQFTQENSPLLSNDIKRIAIDPQTSEVFVATFNGICSFRSTATDGGETNSDVLVFPNPVPPGYTGTIAIKGLVNNATVKITELDGRLVYQTKALGGQAVWDGKTYKGGTVASGVYLVLVTDDTNKEKVVTKIFKLR